MADDALFHIERALAGNDGENPQAETLCRHIAFAVLGGARGTHWRRNFLQLAKQAADQKHSVTFVCALLAELLVAAADEHAVTRAVRANNNVTDALPANGNGDAQATRHNSNARAAAPAGARTQDSLPNKRARLMSRTDESRCDMGHEGGSTSTNKSDGMFAIAGELVNLARTRGRGVPPENILRLYNQRQDDLARFNRCSDSIQRRPRYYGKCPIGHLSVRYAWGGGGNLSVLTSSQEATPIPRPGRPHDDSRKYCELLWDSEQIAKYFEPLKHAIGFTDANDVSVWEDGVGLQTPFRQNLHVSNTPSVIIPMQSSGCQMDCLMKPETEETYFFRVTVSVPAGYCVIFDAFHGGSKGNCVTVDRRLHASLGFSSADDEVDTLARRRCSLKDMLKFHKQEAAKFLNRVPTRKQLQHSVRGAIKVVCKVNKETGNEYEPE